MEGINLCREQPLEQQQLNTITDRESSDKRNEILMRMGEKSRMFFFRLFSEIDTGKLRYSHEETRSLVLWMYSGMKMEINEVFTVHRNVDAIEEKNLPRLDLALKLLAGGIYITIMRGKGPMLSVTSVFKLKPGKYSDFYAPAEQGKVRCRIL